MKIKKIQLNQTKGYQKNIDTFGDDGSNCIICGRRTNRKYHLHMTVDGDFVPTHYEGDDKGELSDGSQSQGCFPIGPICKKKFPKEYIY